MNDSNEVFAIAGSAGSQINAKVGQAKSSASIFTTNQNQHCFNETLSNEDKGYGTNIPESANQTMLHRLYIYFRLERYIQ